MKSEAVLFLLPQIIADLSILFQEKNFLEK